MLTSDSITAIMPAFIKAQGNFAPALKQATNPHFKSKYVALDGVIDAVSEPLRAEGIAIMQQTDVTDHGGIILITRLIHASGEWIASRYPVHPVKNDPQGEGSALTYARRYALMAIAGIAPEDDDGNAAVKATEKSASIGKITPTDGVWNALDSEQQAFLQGIADGVMDIMPDAVAAADYIASQQLETDEKVALWTRLPSQARTALKKAHDAKQKEAA